MEEEGQRPEGHGEGSESRYEQERDEQTRLRSLGAATRGAMVAAMGISPADAANDVVQAIREDRFWIFTHDITPTAAAARFRDIEAKSQPSNPYDGIEGLEELSDLV